MAASVTTLLLFEEAVAKMCSVKKVFLEISQNSQKNTCARVSFFHKVAELMLLSLVDQIFVHS